MASLGLDKLLVWAQRLLQVDGSLFCGDIGADIIQNIFEVILNGRVNSSSAPRLEEELRAAEVEVNEAMLAVIAGTPSSQDVEGALTSLYRFYCRKRLQVAKQAHKVGAIKLVKASSAGQSEIGGKALSLGSKNQEPAVKVHVPVRRRSDPALAKGRELFSSLIENNETAEEQLRTLAALVRLCIIAAHRDSDPRLTAILRADARDTKEKFPLPVLLQDNSLREELCSGRLVAEALTAVETRRMSAQEAKFSDFESVIAALEKHPLNQKYFAVSCESVQKAFSALQKALSTGYSASAEEAKWMLQVLAEFSCAVFRYFVSAFVSLNEVKTVVERLNERPSFPYDLEDAICQWVEALQEYREDSALGQALVESGGELEGEVLLDCRSGYLYCYVLCAMSEDAFEAALEARYVQLRDQGATVSRVGILRKKDDRLSVVFTTLKLLGVSIPLSKTDVEQLSPQQRPLALLSVVILFQLFADALNQPSTIPVPSSSGDSVPLESGDAAASFTEGYEEETALGTAPTLEEAEAEVTETKEEEVIDSIETLGNASVNEKRQRPTARRLFQSVEVSSCGVPERIASDIRAIFQTSLEKKEFAFMQERDKGKIADSPSSHDSEMEQQREKMETTTKEDEMIESEKAALPVNDRSHAFNRSSVGTSVAITSSASPEKRGENRASVGWTTYTAQTQTGAGTSARTVRPSVGSNSVEQVPDNWGSVSSASASVCVQQRKHNQQLSGQGQSYGAQRSKGRASVEFLDRAVYFDQENSRQVQKSAMFLRMPSCAQVESLPARQHKRATIERSQIGASVQIAGHANEDRKNLLHHSVSSLLPGRRRSAGSRREWFATRDFGRRSICIAHDLTEERRCFQISQSRPSSAPNSFGRRRSSSSPRAGPRRSSESRSRYRVIPGMIGNSLELAMARTEAAEDNRVFHSAQFTRLTETREREQLSSRERRRVVRSELGKSIAISGIDSTEIPSVVCQSTAGSLSHYRERSGDTLRTNEVRYRPKKSSMMSSVDYSLNVKAENVEDARASLPYIAFSENSRKSEGIGVKFGARQSELTSSIAFEPFSQSNSASRFRSQHSVDFSTLPAKRRDSARLDDLIRDSLAHLSLNKEERAASMFQPSSREETANVDEELNTAFDRPYRNVRYNEDTDELEQERSERSSPSWIPEPRSENPTECTLASARAESTSPAADIALKNTRQSVNAEAPSDKAPCDLVGLPKEAVQLRMRLGARRRELASVKNKQEEEAKLQAIKRRQLLFFAAMAELKGEQSMIEGKLSPALTEDAQKNPVATEQESAANSAKPSKAVRIGDGVVQAEVRSERMARRSSQDEKRGHKTSNEPRKKEIPSFPIQPKEARETKTNVAPPVGLVKPIQGERKSAVMRESSNTSETNLLPKMQLRRPRPPVAQKAKQETQPRLNNRALIKKALETVCLAGEARRKEREDVMAAFLSDEASGFIILLKEDPSLRFLGLYALHTAVDAKASEGAETDGGGGGQPSWSLDRIAGQGPARLQRSTVQNFFKFDSGSRSFKGIHADSFSPITAAASIRPDLMRRKSSPSRKKLL